MGVGDALNLVVVASRSLCVDLILALDHLIRDRNPWLQQRTFTEERDVLWRQNPPFFVITEITFDSGTSINPKWQLHGSNLLLMGKTAKFTNWQIGMAAGNDG